ncbi:hypothetical protein ACP4OV_009034 [Aristida adscensionis]
MTACQICGALAVHSAHAPPRPPDAAPVVGSPPHRGPRFDAIVSFGDSFADNGDNPVIFAWYDIFNTAMCAPYTAPPSSAASAAAAATAASPSPLSPRASACRSSRRSWQRATGAGDSFRRRGGANFAVGGSNAGFFHDGGAASARKPLAPFPLNTSLGVQQVNSSYVPDVIRSISMAVKLIISSQR